PLGDPSNAPLTAINTMIYIGNIEILTAKSAIYLGNVGFRSVPVKRSIISKLRHGLEKGQLPPERLFPWCRMTGYRRICEVMQ
ncbi:hypothetical protein, partial [Vibrio parahaemolyticus]